MQTLARVLYLPRKTISHFKKMSKSFFTWRGEFEVGHEEMDATHPEFVTCVDALLRAGDDELPAGLEALAEHATRHFAEEDEAMRRGAYSAGGCHVEELTSKSTRRPRWPRRSDSRAMSAGPSKPAVEPSGR